MLECLIHRIVAKSWLGIFIYIKYTNYNRSGGFMKTALLTVLFTSHCAFAAVDTVGAKTWIFSYKSAKTNILQIKKSASTYEEAFKSAAKDCYKQMTQGKYPGEEKGLEIIDICANPKS